MLADAKRIIGAAKAITDKGSWQDGKMPKSAFPLSRAKSFRVSNRRWRALTLEVNGTACRLLIHYSWRLQQYQAMFGVDVGGDTKVLACLEHHPAHHDTWHAHVCCGPLATVPNGIRRGAEVRRLSGAGKPYRVAFPNSDTDAFNIAARFYRLYRRSGEGLHGL